MIKWRGPTLSDDRQQSDNHYFGEFDQAVELDEGKDEEEYDYSSRMTVDDIPDHKAGAHCHSGSSDSANESKDAGTGSSCHALTSLARM